ncbi:high mobility group nucleosome-binding domain-containing protein 3-like [Prionailurus bengalensis]|uniref:high mobility group nucleosome-binding domain-containing protein 3-like n=1 Tax=Prionailurus bengalensis TaxID=37029 RepID=UPI001CAA3403|nr:high mobility group nucleosome-binding domain-containing protein 3-like [Prionailurus bengalensis]
MSKRKSPENTEGKDGSKPTEQETTRQSARLSVKPAPPKAEPEPRKTSANKEPGTKTNKGTKRKEGEQEAGKEDTAPFPNGETKAEKARKAEPVDHRGIISTPSYSSHKSRKNARAKKGPQVMDNTYECTSTLPAFSPSQRQHFPWGSAEA